MAQLAMAILVINMGGEMVYIIDQRLRAQNIPVDKSVRVLEEVTATMFSAKFIDEMFKPHPVQTLETMQQIFRRLAHSSIMRLNEPSMEKLYDLMTMGFKYQLMAAAVPINIVDITHNHLNSLVQLFPASARQCIAVSLIQRTMEVVDKMFAGVADWQLAVLRHRLLDVLQDRKIKVSLLLQGGFQDTNGSIVVGADRSGAINDPLGTVRIFASKLLLSTTVLSLPNRPAAPAASTTAPAPTAALGSNIYENETRPAPSPEPSTAMSAGNAPTTSAPAAPAPLTESLADLIKVTPPDLTFKLDLDLTAPDPSSPSGGSSWSAPQRIVATPVTTKAAILSGLDDDDQQPDVGAELDLLALMDALPPE